MQVSKLLTRIMTNFAGKLCNLQMDPKEHGKISFRSIVVGLWIPGEFKSIEGIHTYEFFRISRKTRIVGNFVHPNGLKKMKSGVAINFSSSFGLSSIFFP
jgi:hypothetical protein